MAAARAAVSRRIALSLGVRPYAVGLVAHQAGPLSVPARLRWAPTGSRPNSAGTAGDGEASRDRPDGAGGSAGTGPVDPGTPVSAQETGSSRLPEGGAAMRRAPLLAILAIA